MRFFILLFVLLPPCLSPAQSTCGSAQSFEILHFTKTDGFDHQTRDNSAAMFTAIGAEQNFTVVNTDQQSAFDDLNTLLGYEVIVFANTSGDIPFTTTQRENLENYVAGGGAVLGIHAATDMYRGNTTFPFYTSLIGGSRRNNPAHTSNSFNGTMDVIGSHPSTANLPAVYPKQEEYYYWPDTGLVSTITEVLRVRSTGSNSYDAARPISWFQEFASGGRSFYTGLGHANGNYTDADNNFRVHLRDALCWCVEAEAASLPIAISSLHLDRGKDLDHVSYALSGDIPHSVELHGGYEQSAANLLTTLRDPALTGQLAHHPADRGRWFYYRLRFTEFDGSTTWSQWLAAPPVANGALPRVLYTDGGAVLRVPQGGPQAAWIIDASGRRVAALELGEGDNPLPWWEVGVYFVRFPFLGEGVRFISR